MDKIEARAVIRYLFLKGKNNEEIKTELDAVYGEPTPSLSTIKYWTAEFRRGRTSLTDEERSGRPKEVTTPEMVDEIHGLVIDDRRVKVREIAEAVGISHERVENILHEYLGMRKLAARWVPRLLSDGNKHDRVTTSKECLEMFKRNPKDFLRRFVTVDETWIHYNTPETKEQSKQWTSPGELNPRKAKVRLSANKVMATVFWNTQGIVHIDYLEKGKTITGEYYAELLERFDADLKQKRPHLEKKKVLFHQDNAPAHKSAIAMEKLQGLGYKLLPHPPYSPDLAPSDYYLFPNLKKWLGGKRFESNDEVITETNAYFEGLDQSYYLEGIKKLENRWTKCIELKGDYVEK